MPTTTQITVTELDMNGVRCQALFCSGLQPSDGPTAEMATTAISRAVQQFGIRGCAAWMAQEFGDHPDMAAERMRWVRQLIAQNARRQAPETEHERDL
jgi:hypothetical protein